MRQKLNENPAAQAVLIAILALAGGYLVLSNLVGGGEESSGGEGAAPASSVTADTSAGGETVEGGSGGAPTSVAAPVEGPLPAAVRSAYAHGETIVLLVVRDGGIDDRLVKRAVSVLRGHSGVALFVVPARQVARYAPITGPLGVESAPALIVVRPHRLNGGGPARATVTYGFQSPSDVEQAVRDTLYKGPKLTYAPN
jgi:hypothetical protein